MYIRLTGDRQSYVTTASRYVIHCCGYDGATYDAANVAEVRIGVVVRR